MIDEFPVWNL